jgi:hypothetical protein
VIVHTCNPRPWEAETGGSRVPGHPGQHREPCLKQKQTNNCKKKIHNEKALYTHWDIYNQ